MSGSVDRKRSFGVSTRLYRGSRLSREHLLDIGGHGFEAVEVVAARTHFDYHNPSAIADLQQWLAEAGLELRSVHAPVAEQFGGGQASLPIALASTDADRRARAVEETERALHIARRIPFSVLVAHLGMPRGEAQAPTDFGRDAARRSIETLQALAEPLGVRIALEVIPNELSRAGSLVHFVEQLSDDAVGICLDLGHAHLDGDLVDAIETVSEHLVAVDVHDNRGRTDDHLIPFEGTIDWPAALTTIQKIGYDSTLLLETEARGSTKETLAKAKHARQRMERLLAF